MQTALLSAGIAIILALVTALVGPLFVDWGSYRADFESEVAHLTGLDVRVTGPIDVRLLPTPTLTLQDIELGGSGDPAKSPAKTRARALRIEFALGDLMRGTWRASDLILQGPELALSLDPSGRLAWSAPTIGLDPDSISIEHLEIEDGRATLADAASGRRLLLEKLEFSGQMRSLLGPLKGEGAFAIDGQRWPFDLSVARPADDGGVNVRLKLEPVDHPRRIEAEGSIFVEHGLPRFEGTLQIARPVGRSPDGLVESWRFTSHVRADGAAAVLEQLDFQYGPEERAIRLKGDARLSLGAKPELVATLSAPQIDLDRLLTLPEAAGRRPLVAIKSLAESFLQAQRLPVPVRLGIGVETVTLAGAMLHRVGGDLSSDGDGWNIENLALRAPGLTQVKFSGRLRAGPGGPTFNGGTRVESADPRALIGWLTDRGDGPAATLGPLRLIGDIALASDKVTFDRLELDLDHMKVEGRLDYVLPDANRPARLDAVLHAPDLDLDRGQSLLQASLGRSIAWPQEGTLAIDIAHATVAGVEAKDIAVKMRRDPAGLDIERFAVGDIGGAKLAVSGHVDTREAAPRGALTLDLDASNLDGMAALVGKVSPSIADGIRRAASRSVPLRLHTSLALDRDVANAAGGSMLAKFKLQGSAGVLRLDVQAEGGGNALASSDLTRVGGTRFHVNGIVDSTDGSVLVEMLGLAHLVTVNQRPGRLTLDLNGPLDGNMAVKGQLLAGGVDVSASGNLQPAGDQGPTAQMALRAAAADVVPLRFATMAQRAVAPPWSTLTARLTLADGALTVGDLDGTLAGLGIKGELGIGMTEPMRVEGSITVGSLDLPAAIGATIGFPHPIGGGNGAWPSDPFEAGLLGDVSGRITVNAGQVALASKVSAHDVHAVVDFDPSVLAVTGIDGALARGRIGGDFSFERGEQGVMAHVRLNLADVDASELLGGGATPLSGRLTAALDLSGSGRSPIALIGALGGTGTFTLRDGGIARLDPAAFDTVTRAVDRGLPIDTTRIGDRLDAALAAGALPVPLAEGTITAAMGQLRLADLAVHAKGAEVAPSGSIDLTQNSIDARLILSGPDATDAAAGRASITVSLKGSIDSPKRTLDVAALTNWLALRAVDQKAKRVDALEQAAREHPDDDSVEATGSTADPIVDPTAPPHVARPPRARPSPEAPARAADDLRRRSNPTVDQVPLPPPLDLRPQSHGPRG